MKPIYKLVPYPNQEGEWLIISDEKILAPSFVFSYLGINNEGSIEFINDEFEFSNQGIENNVLRKICFSTKFIYESIPLIRKEQLMFPDSIEYIANKLSNPFFKDCKPWSGDTAYAHGIFDGVKLGYNKHAETHLFTEDDIRKAFVAGLISKSSDNVSDDSKIVDKYLQFFQQPKKEYIIELEMEGDIIESLSKTTPNIDKEGYINILSIT